MPSGSSQRFSSSRDSSRNLSRMLRRALQAYEAGDLAKADRLYTAVLQEEPNNFDALHGLGKLSCDCRRFDAALALIQRALTIDPGRADGFSSLGLVFYYLRRLNDALTSFNEGLRLAPDDAELLNQRGVALLELGRCDEALTSFAHALAAEPTSLDALGNYGNALLKLNRPSAAIAAYDRALAIVPRNAGLLTNRAIALRKLDRPHEALMSVTRALASKPDFAQARFVDSLVRLTLGDFRAGWRAYESRWQGRNLAAQRRNFPAPLWLGGGSLEGKTVLLHAEQGFGDTLQFVRYAPLVVRQGAKVVLEVQRELVRLLEGLDGVAAVIARGETLPSFDLHCPLLSLPLAFGTEPATIPAPVPYIAAAGDEIRLWRELLPRGRRRIGVAWAGDPAHDNDVNRSMRLKALAPVFDIPDVDFVSLQYKTGEKDVGTLQDFPNLFRLERSFRDFADTAAVVASLDAVISVDSAVAHLAGAMGKELFVLLPLGADFRWLRERADSPWYPTARLLRQTQFGDWSGVIESLAAELRARFCPAACKLSA
ncbi:MAG TPA: tetratricopeptide repeat protein [Xanthobacteraceae bacterium]|jgi:tetratricopeptide (TPR) repeat protein|nr:tetratricopeptide repeat protein [Xanthobacteraceae bacterium]